MKRHYATGTVVEAELQQGSDGFLFYQFPDDEEAQKTTLPNIMMAPRKALPKAKGKAKAKATDTVGDFATSQTATP